MEQFVPIVLYQQQQKKNTIYGVAWLQDWNDWIFKEKWIHRYKMYKITKEYADRISRLFQSEDNETLVRYISGNLDDIEELHLVHYTN